MGLRNLVLISIALDLIMSISIFFQEQAFSQADPRNFWVLIGPYILLPEAAACTETSNFLA